MEGAGFSQIDVVSECPEFRQEPITWRFCEKRELKEEIGCVDESYETMIGVALN